MLKVIVVLNFEWIFKNPLKGTDNLMLGSNLVVESIIDLKSTIKCYLNIP